MKSSKKWLFLPIILAFFFIIPSISAFCFFGVGNTCDNFNGLSSHLRTSYTFDNPFDVQSPESFIWNSAQDNGKDGSIYFRDGFEVSDWLVTGTNSTNFNKRAFNLSFKQINVTMNSEDSFNMNESFSFSMFVKDESSANIDYLSYCVGDNFSCVDGQFRFYRAGGSLTFLLSNGTHFLVTQTTDFPLGNTTNFYQVGFSYDGTQRASGVRLYFNGQIKTFNTPVDELQDADPFNRSKISNFHIGRPAELESSFYSNYTFDNVLLYDIVVQQNFMEALYNNGNGYSHPPIYPSNFRFKDTYDIGFVATGLNPPIAIKGYPLQLDKYFKDMKGLHLDFVDTAFAPDIFRRVNVHKNKIENDCHSGNIILCLTSRTDNNINLTFLQGDEDATETNYFETWYMTAYNGFGYSDVNFNVNSTEFPFPPVQVANFSFSYNLDNYGSWAETEACNSNCRPNLVLKMNDFFSREIIPLRPYTYINVSYQSQNIFIPINNSNSNQICNNGTAVSFYLCYNNDANKVNLIWYSTDTRASTKVNVVAGNKFGFVNTTFGLVSGGAVYTGQLSGEGDISLVGLSSYFNSIFPDADTISATKKYIYTFIFLFLIVAGSLYYTKDTEYGMGLTAVLGALVFTYFVLIKYISIGIVAIVTIIGIGAFILKLRNGNK